MYGTYTCTLLHPWPLGWTKEKAGHVQQLQMAVNLQVHLIVYKVKKVLKTSTGCFCGGKF